MKKAVFYARVSSEAQQKERTIESQIEALKKQIAESGDVLVKDYIDDGYSGAKLDRPALDQMRLDLKTNLFDTIYVWNTDRLARDVTYQNLIIAEILKHKKQIIINGKDYIHNPENKFELTVLGAVSELERAKIIERSMRGKLHRLRQGFLLGNGYNTYGYTYTPRDRDIPATYVINEKEAEVVRYIFESYAREGASWSTIVRNLEDRGTRTQTGKTLWKPLQLRYILQNHAYAGIKYFNTRSLVKNPSNPLRGIKYGKKVFKDRSEWIGVKVPAIVSEKLFDMAQARMETSRKRYRNPIETQLLSGLVKCGSCGRSCTAYQRFLRHYRTDKGRRIKTANIYHKAAYRCLQRTQQVMHSRKSDVVRCSNPEISTRILDPLVFKIIKESLIDPLELKKYLDYSKDKIRSDHAKMERQLEAIEERLRKFAKERHDLLTAYAKGKFDRTEYNQKCLWYDNQNNKAKAERRELMKKIPLLHKGGVVDASVRQFCDTARAQLEKCNDFDSKRQFALDHIEKIIYDQGKTTIVGSVPIKLSAYSDPDQTSEAEKITFRIIG
jgi:DNA invertase Pin-like site-specific DNA recombinase